MWLSTSATPLLLLKPFAGPSTRRLFAAKPGQFFPAMPAGYKIKRFYKKVDVVEHPMSGEAPKLPPGETVSVNNLSLSDKYWAVTLDGKVTKTMYKDNLLIPSKAMAVALAEEWESQQEHINLKTLSLVYHEFSSNNIFRTTTLPNA